MTKTPARGVNYQPVPGVSIFGPTLIDLEGKMTRDGPTDEFMRRGCLYRRTLPEPTGTGDETRIRMAGRWEMAARP